MNTDAYPAARPHRLYMFLLVVLTLLMVLPGLGSIPVIDRDEARYTQATVQMVESGDYLNIKFQDRARNKKPAGIYWMQAGSVKAFTKTGERKIWAHRIPSVIGALIAVLATYWAGCAIYNRNTAFLSAGILATSAIFVFEAHIAKTDAMLCGMAALSMACLIQHMHSPNRWIPVLFWGAMGMGIMIKGPIVPAITILSLFGLCVWERRAGWMKSLLSFPGILLCLLLILPWSFLIWQATDGAFFSEAIGGDLAPKLAGGQESHGAPVGYYTLTLPLLFWPGSLLLFSGLLYGWRTARNTSQATPVNRRIGRFLLLWAILFWAALELVPTKLPNYLLPIYPALALLCGGAIHSIRQNENFTISRKIGSVIFLLISLVLIATVLSGEALYASSIGLSRWIAIFCVITTCIASLNFWSRHIDRALLAGSAGAVVLTAMTYQLILPNLDKLQVSHNIEAALQDSNILLSRQNGPAVFSPHFTEPSLVYRLGTNIVLGDKTEEAIASGLKSGDILLFDTASPENQIKLQQLRASTCFKDMTNIKGLNYSKGDEVNIAILKATPCP